MTGGTVVFLGSVGRNFAAGLTGGVVFALDRKRTLAARVNPQLVSVDALVASDRKYGARAARSARAAHWQARLARSILRNNPSLTAFVRLSPVTVPVEQTTLTEVRAVNE